MATYDVKDKIKKIAKLEEKDMDQVAEELGIDTRFGRYEAWNRREEGAVNARLEKALQAQARKERLAGFHWVKDDEGWAVAGPFEDHKVGDTVSVKKVSGEVQDKIIVRFSENGNAYVK